MNRHLLYMAAIAASLPAYASAQEAPFYRGNYDAAVELSLNHDDSKEYIKNLAETPIDSSFTESIDKIKPKDQRSTISPTLLNSQQEHR